jgi:hypothetical protein
MKRYAALLAVLSSAPAAHAIPVQYEFSATIDSAGTLTLDPVPAEITASLLTLVGQEITGTFWYDNEAPLLFSFNNTSFYSNARTNLVASFAGETISIPTGSATVSSAGQDSFVLGSGPTVGQVLGWDVTSITIAWVEGVPAFDPIPPFLVDDSLLGSLPGFRPQVNVGFAIPGLTPIGALIKQTGFASAFQGSLRQVAVPEPGTLSLLVLGLLVFVSRRRDEARLPLRPNADASSGPSRLEQPPEPAIGDLLLH